MTVPLDELRTLLEAARKRRRRRRKFYVCPAGNLTATPCYGCPNGCRARGVQ